MSTTEKTLRTAWRGGGLVAGLLALGLPLAACGGGAEPVGPEPRNISIAPSSTRASASAAPSTPEAASPTAAAHTASTERLDLAGAVSVAQSTVADSTVVEISEDDDDGAGEWEVTVRAGSNARELRIGTDGSVRNNQSESLSDAQRGDLPRIKVLEAVEIAEDRVSGGAVTDAELTTEDGQRVWDVSLDDGGDETELWIDAGSGEVLRVERD